MTMDIVTTARAHYLQCVCRERGEGRKDAENAKKEVVDFLVCILFGHDPKRVKRE